MTSFSALRRQVEDAAVLQAKRIPLSRLRFHPENARQDLGDLRSLAQSLREDGCHQPIEVFRGSGAFVVQDGNRRLAAAQLAGLKTLPAFIVPERPLREQRIAMLATDVHKKHLTPPERGRAVRELIDEFGTVKEVAARLGVSEGTVYRWRTEGSEASPTDVLVDGETPAEPTPVQSAGGRPGAAGSTPVSRPARAPQRRNVGPKRLDAFVADWTPRCTEGLTAEQVTELFEGLLALAAPGGGR